LPTCCNMQIKHMRGKTDVTLDNKQLDLWAS